MSEDIAARKELERQHSCIRANALTTNGCGQILVDRATGQPTDDINAGIWVDGYNCLGIGAWAKP